MALGTDAMTNTFKSVRIIGKKKIKKKCLETVGYPLYSSESHDLCLRRDLLGFCATSLAHTKHLISTF